MHNLSEKIKALPPKPGVYQFLDQDGRIIYIGKAKNLRARVRQYFGRNDSRPQIPFLLKDARDLNYTLVNNELESLYLENTLIKQYHPKYNIDLKDDKNYAFIKIDYSTQIPTIGYARKIESPLGPKRPEKTSRYFGPYSAAYKIRQTLNLARRIFSYCSADKVGSRPCFYYHMHRCPGVCVGKISPQDYRAHLEKIIKFLQGDTAGAAKDIRREMLKAAKAKKFEAAARLRDQLRALELLNERQNVILPKPLNWDAVALATAGAYACINLFKIRQGKMFDKENFIYRLPESGTDAAEPLETFLENYYLEASDAPRAILIPQTASNASAVQSLIKTKFGRGAELLSPKKGQGAKLLRLGTANAEEYLKNWLADKAGSQDKISQALSQMQTALGLPKIPRRIECYDISNIQGTNPVGSMAVFIDGLPKKSEYRKFKIRKSAPGGGPDDFAMMKEMLRRRMERGGKKPETTDRWPLPDLIVIDGGKGQLSAALSVLKAAGRALPIIGLAKQLEEIFLPGAKSPLILAHNQPGLQLLQRLRDEAHRFGITFHRQLRGKAAVKSALDEIPGIGPKTKKLLKAKFGTVSQIKQAPDEDLEQTVGPKLARLLREQL